MARTGVYPGSFNPLTVAHLGIAEAARDAHSLERVDLAVSRTPLGKGPVARPRFEDRIRVLEAAAATRPWLGVLVTEAQLLADIAAGYDVLILGADKWSQVLDPVFYESESARDQAVARLPTLAIVARPPFPCPEEHALAAGAHLLEVSSTAARAGRTDWMAPEAREFDEATGAWSDPDRYDDWLRRMGS